MYGEVGWRDLKYDMDLRLLRFAGRLWAGGLPGDRWVLKVFAQGMEDVLEGRETTPWCKRLASKIEYYRLDPKILGEFREWRVQVDKMIAQKAEEEWRGPEVC